MLAHKLGKRSGEGVSIGEKRYGRVSRMLRGKKKKEMKKELSHNISILPFLINFFIPVVCTRVKRDREGGKERKKKNSNKYSAIKENSRSKAILVEQFLERGILE